MDDIYRKQVELLIRCLPEVEKQACFALKGGMAINLFVRDMPRLSIDIDLVYLPIEPRAQTLTNIENALNYIGSNIELSIKGSAVSKDDKEKHVNKLHVEFEGARIKIEPNIVQRGTVYPVAEMSLCKRAETEFEASTTVTCLTLAELYGSKICAALDRQHPRDLFDVKLLLENEGLTGEIRKAFVVYLASHPRPMNELLNPNFKNIEQQFHSQFQGMSYQAIGLNELLGTREQLVKLINADLTLQERNFLISVKSGSPDWSLMGIPDIELLPAIQWKIQNIQKMGKAKKQEATDKLRRVLKL